MSSDEDGGNAPDPDFVTHPRTSLGSGIEVHTPALTAADYVGVEASYAPLGRSVRCCETEGMAPQGLVFMDWFDTTRPKFTILSAAVVIANAIVIGLETELGDDKFVPCEHIFVALFLAEMLLRLYQIGCRKYMADKWFVFDAILVVVGVLDLWVLPILTEEDSSLGRLTSLRLLRLMRILRLLRVLRMVRLLAVFGTLVMVTKAIGRAFQVVCALAAIVTAMNYVLAIFLTQLVGHHASQWAEFGKEDEITHWFGDIGSSMRTLFRIMTLDNWSEIVMTVGQVAPPLTCAAVFVSYVFLTAYAFVCLITSLLSSQLIQAQLDTKEKRVHEIEDLRAVLATQVREHVQEGHESPLIDAPLLKDLLDEDETLLSRLEELDIKTTKAGLHNLVDGLLMDGFISIDHFVEKIVNLSGAAKGQSIVDLKHLTLHGHRQIFQLHDQMLGLEKRFNKDLEKINKQLDVLANRSQ